MEESTLLRKIKQREDSSEVSQETFLCIPLWRIIRFRSRLYYIFKYTNYEASTGETKFIGRKKIKLFSGFWRVICKKHLNIFYTFNRLVVNNGYYLDKFIDPVIECSGLKRENYVIIDPPNYVGDYARIHKDRVNDNEVRTVSKLVLKYLMLLVVPFIMKKKIKRLFAQAQIVYELPDFFINQFNRDISLFVAEYIYNLFWFKILRPQRVLIVYRENFFAQIAVCKRLGIPIAEFQHGITLDNTVSFTGDYDSRIDPDYFLTFGNYWKGENFGMTNERTICIGWAYRKIQQRLVNDSPKRQDDILIISSPEISDSILSAVTTLSQWNPLLKFSIRLHPNESYNDDQMTKLSKINQAVIADNSNDSSHVLPLYKYVLGENSSVLYEALSMGCKVGMLNICGLHPPVDKPGIPESFSIIRNSEDFNNYLGGLDISDEKKVFFYSEFNKSSFEEFLLNKM